MILGVWFCFFTPLSVSGVCFNGFLTHMIRYLIIALCLFETSLFGFSEEQLRSVADSTQWHRLLHYKRALPFFNLRSEVDGSGFFFSPTGKTDPLSELRASLKAYDQNSEVGKFKLHPQCAFPARFQFLQRALHLKPSKVKCEKFDEVLETAKPHSVTLVFSSAYPNNPASMFGHTFLRLNREQSTGKKKVDMLDYGVSFAASVAPDENPLSFIAFGLTGGYRGQFSYVPYYVKVNEYNNSESRDVWEYDLSLTPEETRFLLAHVWELETNSHFDYYFFDENCSYQMLTVIEAAKPDWNLSNFSLSVIPSETIKKIVAISGAVTGIHYRPSLRQRMVEQIENLSVNQKSDLKSVLDKQVPPKKINDPFVLDAAIASLFYEKNEKDGMLNASKKELQAGLLLQRSKLGTISGPERRIAHELSRPDLGHYAFRISISPGYFASSALKGGFQELGIKSAYHDLLNKDLGFLRFSQIDFPQVYFRYFTNQNSLQLENLEFLHITSLFPLSVFEKRPSWKLQLAYGNNKNSACLFCKSFLLRGGLGASVNLFDEHSIFYALILARAELGTAFSRRYRVGPEAQLAAIFNPMDDYKTRLAVGLTWDLAPNSISPWIYQAEWEHALSLSQSWEIRAAFGFWGDALRQWNNAYQEGKLSLNYYF